MTEGKNNSENDDLSEFADYLAEFESTIGFDAETCPVCGVNISSSFNLENSPFVEYKKVKKESELIPLTEELELKCIRYKIEKQLDSTSTAEINYNFTVLIPINCLDKLKIEKV
jgi:hypothetical protein